MMDWKRLMGLALVTSLGCGGSAEETAPPINPCSVGFGAASGYVIEDVAGASGCHWQVSPGPYDQIALQTVFIEAKQGQTICLGEGTFRLTRELSLTTSHITLRGAGRDSTVLDFSEQNSGANGVHILADNTTVESLKVLDSAGDGIRASRVHNIVFRDVAVIWSQDQSKESGAYGLYPVQADGVLVEGCVVKGSRDAGIYVGQSRNIIVRNNEAYGNVAGIEIENSFDALVHDNHAHDNAGGILIFNLPNLPLVNGERTTVRDNIVESNNTPNFGIPGTTVGQIPSGTGIIVMAVDRTHVHHNLIQDNATAGVMVLAYTEDIFGKFDDPSFDRYPEGNFVYDNTYVHNGYEPQGLATLIHADPVANPPLADLNDSGCLDPDKDPAGEFVPNCYELAEGTFLQFDLCGGFQNKTEDPAPYDCSYPPLETPTVCSSEVGCAADIKDVTPPPLDPDVGCARPYPLLSDYGYFEGELLELQPAPGVIPYDVSAPLWSDNSAKKRFIVLPEGKSATVDESGAVQFPIGTALIKNFGFPSTPDGQLRWVETRLLVHEAEGWVGHVYLWNDEQTDAKRYVAGAEVTVQRMTDSGEELEQQYIVPSTTQCVSCHGLDEAVVPLGLVAHQLNRSVKRGDGELNQLTWLSQQGVFGESVLAPEDYKTLPDPFGEEELDSRARAYLEVNCAHCHRAGGNAESAGLSFVHTETDPTALGICKTTVAAGAGAGEFKFDIVPGNAAESILVFRMSSTDPGIKMPELPTLLPHQEGVELVRAWIDAMPSNDCSVSTDESESSADSE